MKGGRAGEREGLEGKNGRVVGQIEETTQGDYL